LIDSEEVTKEDLITCHSTEHIDNILLASMDKNKKGELIEVNKNQRNFSYDTYENRHTAQALLLSAGGSLEAMRAVCSGSMDSDFALLRPPGHHAHCE